jgi:hypothetical protein
MTLLGLTLQQLGLIFGAAGAAVTLLYILKLRRRRVRVPFAKLWERVLQERESSSLFRRLKRLLSLLLQLAFLVLLTAALGDPRLSSEVLEGRHIILLVDTSASMKAVDEAEGTRVKTAVARARKIIRGMNGADALMIVRMDAQVSPVSGFESDEKPLLKALAGIQATDTRADLRRALKFAADALRERENPELILISDGAFEEQLLRGVVLDGDEAPARDSGASSAASLDRIDLRGVAVRYVPVGRTGDNVGIVAFNARRYVRNKMSFEIFMEVVSFNQEPVEADLQLLADGEIIDVQRLALQPGERARYSCDPDETESERHAWCDIAATGELLEARLVPPGGADQDKAQRLDALPVDDHAYALLPRRKKQRILLVTPGNLYLEGVLLLEPNLEVTTIQPEEYNEALARRHDALIFDGSFPAEKPPRHVLVFNPPAEGSPIEVEGSISGPLITDQNRDHPVMRWVTLKDVNISRAAKLRRGPEVEPLASSFKVPLIAAAQRGDTKAVVFGFDLKQSDLPLRVAFPILIMNSIDWFSGDSERLVTSYATGHTWAVPVDGTDDDRMTVLTPDGQRHTAPVHDGQVLLYGDRVGLYRLGTPEPDRRLAANLADSVESKIAPRAELILDGQKLTAPAGFGIGLRREIWIYLLIAALILSLVEWATYNRRVTV